MAAKRLAVVNKNRRGWGWTLTEGRSRVAGRRGYTRRRDAKRGARRALGTGVRIVVE